MLSRKTPQQSLPVRLSPRLVLASRHIASSSSCFRSGSYAQSTML